MLDVSKMEPIDGSPVVSADTDGDRGSIVITEDGRHWYWYYEADTNYGEWREYKSSDPY